MTDGEFLIRESTKKQGQYVLTGMASGKPQHLLLMDKEGRVCMCVCGGPETTSVQWAVRVTLGNKLVGGCTCPIPTGWACLEGDLWLLACYTGPSTCLHGDKSSPLSV